MVDEQEHIKFNKIPWKVVSETLEKSFSIGDFNMRLIRLMPNQDIPHHRHYRKKYNYVLRGYMEDERGKYEQGDLVINEINSEHYLRAGPKGCEFLVFWHQNL